MVQLALIGKSGMNWGNMQPVCSQPWESSEGKEGGKVLPRKTASGGGLDHRMACGGESCQDQFLFWAQESRKLLGEGVLASRAIWRVCGPSGCKRSVLCIGESSLRRELPAPHGLRAAHLPVVGNPFSGLQNLLPAVRTGVCLSVSQRTPMGKPSRIA